MNDFRGAFDDDDDLEPDGYAPHDPEPDVPIPDFEKRLSDDIKAAAALLGRQEARLLMDTFYGFQKLRVAASNRAAATVRAGEPAKVISFIGRQLNALENQLKAAMTIYAQSSLLGRWLLSQHGIGPISAAALLAYIDIDKARHSGNIIRFAGLDPTAKWIGRDAAKQLVDDVMGASHVVTGDHLARVAVATTIKPHNLNGIALTMLNQAAEHEGEEPVTELVWTRELLEKVAAVRPWNHRLKMILWRLSDVMVKHSANPKCYYGHVYVSAKAKIIQNNANGGYRHLAERSLKERKIVNKKLRKTYEGGMIPDGRMDLTARRVCMTLLLSHLWEVGVTVRDGRRPTERPWVIEVGSDVHPVHRGYMPPPGIDWVEREVAASRKER